MPQLSSSIRAVALNVVYFHAFSAYVQCNFPSKTNICAQLGSWDFTCYSG